MPPKKKGAKKGKSALSRGRSTKQKEDVFTTATSDTDDNNSEILKSAVCDTDNSYKSRSRHPSSDISKERSDQSDQEKASKSELQEGWEDLPDLVEELRVRGGDGTITYVTNTREHREFELDARKELLQMHFELENLKATFDAALRVMRNLYPVAKHGKVSRAVKTLNYPNSFGDFVIRLMSLPPLAIMVPHFNVDEPIFEESESEMEEPIGIPFSLDNFQQKRFPSPAKMAKFQTPKHQCPSSINGVFQFGTNGKGLSTNKAPRPAKPGEVVYSEGGSPILQRRILENQEMKTSERVEIFQPDGTKYEVDIVYRGGHDTKKLRGFKEFAKDVRGIAASRSTSVKQNRIQPPKILKSGSQSASKGKKPDWR